MSLPFCPPPWVRRHPRRGYGVVPAAGAATLPPSADGESPAEVQRKTPRPERANTLTQFAHPGFPVQKRSRPVGANTLTQFAYPGRPVQEKEPPCRGEPACGSSRAPLGRCRKRGNLEKIFPPEKAAKTPVLTPRKRLSERYS